MAELPNITEAEWRVMQVLWDDAPLTAADVVERIADAQDWSPRTVKTLLRRLAQKGALSFKPDGNRYLYRPSVSRNACLRRASRTMLDRVFDGDAALMLTHLVRQRRLSRDEIESLKSILDGKER